MSVSSPSFSLAVLGATAADADTATVLAAELDLPVVPSGDGVALLTDFDAVLLVSGTALALQQTGKGAPGPVQVDFASRAMRHRRSSGHNELLGRAVGATKKSGLRVLDATAGLGRDSFVMADLGCRVTLCERDPVVARMLLAGIHTALQAGDPWLQDVLARMRLVPADARETGRARLLQQDVIYLDPMFPQRSKSAAVKKEMALFQLLLERETDLPDADELLLWALATGVTRVVVKRPSKAPPLAGRRPSHQIAGKAVRYDVYQQGKPA